MGALVTGAVILADQVVQVVGGTLIKSNVIAGVRAQDLDDGPFLFGVATRGLSVTEIAAYFANNGPSGPTHSGQTELASRGRHIRIIGAIGARAKDAVDQSNWEHFEKVIKMGWAEQDGGYAYWIMNIGADLLTGSTFFGQMADFVVWDKD